MVVKVAVVYLLLLSVVYTEITYISDCVQFRDMKDLEYQIDKKIINCSGVDFSTSDTKRIFSGLF